MEKIFYAEHSAYPNSERAIEKIFQDFFNIPAPILSRTQAGKKLLPGYVLVKMLMTDETWYIVRNTRGVTGFVGAGNKATPLSETDFASVFASVPQTRIDIQVGDNVRILAGLFENFTGKVTEIDLENQKIKVVVPMLKRETDVELGYDEVVRED